ncbi:MAG: phosphate signaling complex protein PhoU [Chloroflexi bacterium]|nr:phosphate signaling complex protein PhoU [Chloroflexota bacterium]
MPRKTLDERMRALLDNLVMLGHMVEDALVRSVDALKRRDFDASRQLIEADREINRKRYDIEEETLVLLATQQPMATDLRILASVLEIATELERIGDYAKGIARINLKIGDEPLIKPLIDLPRMAEIAAHMLHQALEAFVNRDVETAYAIIRQDDEVDALYDQVYRELMTLIVQNPRYIEQTNYLLWAAHNLERSADRVTNICERTIFVVTGRIEDLDVTEPPEDVE